MDRELSDRFLIVGTVRLDWQRLCSPYRIPLNDGSI